MSGQMSLNNYLESLTKDSIKCLDEAVSLDAFYSFQCGNCNRIWKGRIPQVWDRKCPNKLTKSQKRMQARRLERFNKKGSKKVIQTAANIVRDQTRSNDELSQRESARELMWGDFVRDQKCLNNCIIGIEQLHIKCLDTVLSLAIVYKFQCELCDHIWEGKINLVNGVGCPNKPNHQKRKKSVILSPHPIKSLNFNERMLWSKTATKAGLNAMYIRELKKRGITSVQNDGSKSIWWQCNTCEYTWEESFDVLIVKLDTVDSPCVQCVKRQTYDDESPKRSEIRKYESEIKENLIKCLKPMSDNDTNQWKCLKCGNIWENNFNCVLYPYDGCVNCKRINAEESAEVDTSNDGNEEANDDDGSDTEWGDLDDGESWD